MRLVTLGVGAIRRLADARGLVPYAGSIGRPTLRALDVGLSPTFGEFATDRQAFVLGRRPQ